MPRRDAESSRLIRLPIFPLPNVVFFPRTRLPLHVFEPRYRRMVTDALGGNRLIGMILLRPGWERDYYQTPEVFTTGSMGLIAEHRLLEGGEYDIVLEGSDRYQIVRFVQDAPYRVAQVRLLEETPPGREEGEEIAAELMLSFQELSEAASPVLALDVLEKLDFSTLVHSICSMINLSVYDRQSLLERESLKSRAESLRAVLRRHIAEKRFTARYRHLKPQDPSSN